MTRAEGDLLAEIEVRATRVGVMWRDEGIGRVDPRSAEGPTILTWEFSMTSATPQLARWFAVAVAGLSAIDMMFFLVAGLPG